MVEITVTNISVDFILHVLSQVQALLSQVRNSTLLRVTRFNFHTPAAVIIVI